MIKIATNSRMKRFGLFYSRITFADENNKVKSKKIIIVQPHSYIFISNKDRTRLLINVTRRVLFKKYCSFKVMNYYKIHTYFIKVSFFVSSKLFTFNV